MSDTSGLEADELPIEAPEADAAEQHRPVTSSDDPRWPGEIPLEADPADTAEQRREVDLDEDDYR
ncbi:hypothetical protein J5X84_32820 [Streptosporangiaceae bacterium NEAU-GS5]|nr:hypothetical protein [Streptosporangiaceae bacterium NEAU-GS5]